MDTIIFLSFIILISVAILFTLLESRTFARRLDRIENHIAFINDQLTSLDDNHNSMVRRITRTETNLIALAREVHKTSF